MEQIRAISSAPGWRLEESFVDWLHVRQPNLGRYPVVNDGRVIRLDRDGQVLSETAMTMAVEGSFDTSIRLRITDEFLEISGNPARFDRAHNLFGFTFEKSLDIFDQVLHRVGASALDRSSAVKGETSDGNLVRDGFRVLRIDLTFNVMFGSPGRLQSFLRAMRRHGISRYKTERFQTTVSFASKSHVLKIYDKGRQFLDLGVAPEAVGRWCFDNGIARFETTLKRDKLRRSGLRYGRAHSEFLPVIREEVMSIPERVDEVDVSGLTDRELGTFCMWQLGHRVRELLPIATFYRRRKAILKATGFDVGTEPPLQFKQKFEPIVGVQITEEDLPEHLRA